MKKAKFLLVTSILIFNSILLPGLVRAVDLKIEAGSDFGVTDNLLKDSSQIYDVYLTQTVRLSLYPLSSLEIRLGAQHSYYREVTGLSNVFGQVGLTFIPTPRTSPFSLYLSGNFSGIRYHSQFNGFDNNIGDATLGVGYDIAPTVSARAGISHRATSYISKNMEDKEDLEYFVGGNVTAPGSVAVDFECGFARANYTYLYIDNIFDDIFMPLYPPDSLERRSEVLWVFYFSPRISRVIAPKTGLNIMFTRRNFQNYHNQIIFGFSTQYLSPWASVWAGQSVSASIKSFIIPRLILTAGTGYWDKKFLKTVEARHKFNINLWEDRYNRRRDWQTRIFGSVQWPMSFHSGVYFEPSLRVDYADNKSSEDLYKYSDLTVMVFLLLRI